MVFVETIILCCILFLLASVLVWYYVRKDTPLYVSVLSFVGWFLGFAIIGILPFDIFLAREHWNKKENGDEEEARADLLTVWTTIYWTSFIFCWLVLPMLNSYLDSCDFTFKGRLCYSLKINGIVYGIGAVLLGIFLLYCWLDNNEQLKNKNLTGFLICLGNAWGLFLIIFFLGNGLVALPRFFWQGIRIKARYERVVCRAAAKVDYMEELKYAIEGIAEKAVRYQGIVDPKYQQFVDIIVDKVPLEFNAYSGVRRAQDRTSESGESGVSINYKKIVKLHTQLCKNLHEYSVLENQYQRLLKKAFKLEDIMSAKEDPNAQIIESKLKRPRQGTCGGCIDKLEYIWHCKLYWIINAILFVIFLLFAFLIVLGECTLFSEYNFALFGLLIKMDLPYLILLLVCGTPLLIVTLCSYYGIFNFKLSGFYALHTNHQTDGVSITYSSLFLCKLAPPLCLNFLYLSKVYRWDTTTQFMKIMGNMDLVPIFGTPFQKFFPTVLVFFCVINFFNIYGKIMRAVGLESLTFVDIINQEKFDEGKQIIERGNG